LLLKGDTDVSYELVNCTDSVWNGEFELPYKDQNIALVKGKERK
jgi:hypothetical protein